MNSRGKIKAIALFSGGLDSCLAVKLIALQGIEVIAIYYDTPFCSLHREVRADNGEQKTKPYMEILKDRAEQSGGILKVVTVGQDYIDLVANPEHGYGANMNPCIDCKIYFYRRSYEIMKETGARFIVTGEVLGQRPMTQMKPTLMKMEKIAGVKRLVLRPLSAKVLPRTIPEEKGWVNSSELCDIQGRSRTRQLKMAEKYNITDFPTPAGGCLLTDKGFSRRLKDLFEHKIFDINDITMIKTGRHFRFSEDVKFIVGRDQKDNEFITNLVQEGDILVEVEGYGSPLCVLRGEGAERFLDKASQICKRYSKGRNKAEAVIKYWKVATPKTHKIIVKGRIDEKEIRELMIK